MAMIWRLDWDLRLLRHWKYKTKDDETTQANAWHLLAVSPIAALAPSVAVIGQQPSNATETQDKIRGEIRDPTQ